MPRCAKRCWGRPFSSRPLKSSVPDVGVSAPESRLKKVLLPAPLGPMTAVSCPRRKGRGDAFERDEGAEGRADVLGVEQRRSWPRLSDPSVSSSVPQRPLGRNSTNRTKTAPTKSCQCGVQTERRPPARGPPRRRRTVRRRSRRRRAASSSRPCPRSGRQDVQRHDRQMQRQRAGEDENRPDSTKASSLVRSTSKPQARARCSFSRIASMTAPKGEFRMREDHIASADEGQQHEVFVQRVQEVDVEAEQADPGDREAAQAVLAAGPGGGLERRRNRRAAPAPASPSRSRCPASGSRPRPSRAKAGAAATASPIAASRGRP